MENFRFELWDILNLTKQGNLNVTAGKLIEALAGEHTLQLEIDPVNIDGETVLGLYGESADMTIQAQKYIHMVSTTTGATEYFIIRDQFRTRSATDELRITVNCEHYKYKLIDLTVRIEREYTQINSTELLTLVMAYASGFSVVENQIPTTIYRDISLNYPTVLGVLKLICDTYTQFDGSIERKFYYTVNSAGEIRIRREDSLGSVAAYPLLVKHNLLTTTKRQDTSSLANRIFLSGLGNTIGFADSLSHVDSSDSAGDYTYAGGIFNSFSETFNLNDGGSSSLPAAWESVVLIRLNSVYAINWPSGSGSFIITVRIELLDISNNVITSTTVDLPEVTFPNRIVGNPGWFRLLVPKDQAVRKIRYTTTGHTLLGGADPLGIRVNKIDLQYDLAPNIDYVEDLASQGDFGRIEVPLYNDQHNRVINILKSWKNHGGSLVSLDSTLSTGYSGGLNSMFRIIGSSVTATENSNRLYIVNGTRSQRIQVNSTISKYGVGFGSQFPRLPEGWSHQFYLLLYIATGTLEISLRHGYPTTSGAILFKLETSSSGWTELFTTSGFGIAEGLGASTFDLNIIAKYKIADFYIDALCVARSDEQIKFYKDSSANVLKDRATRLLRINAYPRIQYQLGVSDLANVDRYYSSATLNVGDDVIVKDNISQVEDQVKIFRKEQDLFDPNNVQLTLADRTVGLGETINTLTPSRNLRGL